jgi:4-amino-4-deoxy-L-arabinose transferase-like glycosyltransferase
MTLADNHTRPSRARRVWPVLGLGVLAAWMAGVCLWQPALIDPDEPRTALVARIIVERGDWLVPHLPSVYHHDYKNDPVEGDLLAYWDKPPLYFWLEGVAMKILGPTPLAARLPAALGFFVTVLLVYAAGRSLAGERAGLLAGLVMALASLPLAMAHTARMDSLLVALMAAMLLAILRLLEGHAPSRPEVDENDGTRRSASLQETPPRRWLWVLVLYGAAGLGALAKGPEALAFPAAAVFVTVVLSGRWRDLARLRPLEGAVIVLAIAAPWYVYMHLRYPAAEDGSTGGFLYEFLIRQHFGRVVGGEYGHSMPPGSLVGILLVGFMPWTLFLPGVFSRVRKGWRERRGQPAAILLAAWVVLVTGVFSVSKGQLPHYILPAFPPLAILVGVYLSERFSATAVGRLFLGQLFVAAVLGVLTVAGLVAGLIAAGVEHPLDFTVAAVLGVVEVIGIVALIRKRYPAVLGWRVASLIVFVTFILAADPFHLYTRYSSLDTMRTLEACVKPGDALVSYPSPRYSCAWVWWPRPMLYPTDDRQPTGEANRDDLAAVLNGPRRTYCILQVPGLMEELKGLVKWPLREIPVENAKDTLLVTEPPAGFIFDLPQKHKGK